MLIPMDTAVIKGLPLFLLNTVLFPQDELPLRVFETRYMDMISHCLKTHTPFGICAIRHGAEVGELAEPYAVGTIAEVVRWEMPSQGVLHLLVRGGARFEIQRSFARGKLLLADVAVWDDEPDARIPTILQSLSQLLEQLLKEYGHALIPTPHRLNSASWVGMRLAQLLPMEIESKQKWLQHRDPVARLDAIEQALFTLAHEESD